MQLAAPSLVAQMVKSLPEVWETWVWSLGWEDPLEKEMATHSSILVWKIPWMEEPGELQPMGLPRVRHDWTTSLSLYATGLFTEKLYGNDHLPCDTVQRGTAQRDWLIIHLVSQPEFRISEMAWRWLESLGLGKACLASWRKKQQPTPVFLLGESHGQRGLVGYRSWDHKESDTMSDIMCWVTKHNV